MVYLGVKVLDMEIVQAAALGLCVAVFAAAGRFGRVDFETFLWR